MNTTTNTTETYLQDMSSNEATKVYLVVESVIRRRGGISEQTQSWYRSKWIARRTGTVMYTSKLCGAMKGVDAVFKARELAEKWLTKQNASGLTATGPGVRFVDTTGNPNEVY